MKSSARKEKRDQTSAKLTLSITSSVSTQNLALTTHQSGVNRKLLTPSERAATEFLCEHNERIQKPHLQKCRKKCRRISQRMLQMEKENTSEYENFKKDLGSKEGCHSTIFKGCDDTNLVEDQL
ncbi:hypothetical protein FQR65_LT00036 [Abscondita terminalis]|nr:hypothetical protein FQR65_LT00036 [Abscondita terminalis]